MQDMFLFFVHRYVKSRLLAVQNSGEEKDHSI
jgi:hypothetical protein